MESTVVQIPLNEADIKPTKALEVYKSMINEECKKFFGEIEKNSKSSCPACNSKIIIDEFNKIGFSYSKCGDCLTVYSSFLIPDKNITEFFKQSKSREYWFDNIWRQTAETRISKILTPLCEWIDTLMIENQLQGGELVEYAPVHWGLFEAFERIHSRSRYKICSPRFNLEISKKYFNFKNDYLEEDTSDKKFASVVLFDSLNRTTKPDAVLHWANQHLKEGGLCFVTTLLSTGLDLQILGASSARWLPPDHLNAFSIEGIEEMAKKHGFEVVELSTPGVLDIVQLESAVKENSKMVPEFFKYIFNKRKDPLTKEMLQEFLQRWNLSSLGRMVLKKG